MFYFSVRIIDLWDNKQHLFDYLLSDIYFWGADIFTVGPIKPFTGRLKNTNYPCQDTTFGM